MSEQTENPNPQKPQRIPFDLKDFYLYYSHNYFQIKRTLLQNLLGDLNGYAGMFNENPMVSAEDLKSSLKLEIRGTYFQAIETLFELLFALEKQDDEEIWKILANSGRSNYARIESIANGDHSFFEKKIKVKPLNQSSEVELSLLLYLVYYRFAPIELSEDWNRGLETIKSFLIQIGKDFSDRIDYNAFKHGLRLFPTLRTITFGKKEYDLSNSYTILKGKKDYDEEEKQDTNDQHKSRFRIVQFDLEHDLRMIELCGELISNIILTRRCAYYPDEKKTFYYFNKINYDDFIVSNVKFVSFNFTVEKIFRSEDSADSNV